MRISHLILVVFSVLLLGSCKKAAPAGEEQETDSNVVELNSIQMKQITTDTVRVREEKTDLVLSGKVTFDGDFVTGVYSFVSGNVVKVNVSLGDHVTKGQVLATLRSGEISDYEGQLSVAEAQVKTAKRNLDVANELYQTKVYSQRDVMQAQNDYKAATTNLYKVQTYLKTYGVNDTNENPQYNLISPIDGYVVSKNINEGMNVRPDNTSSVFTISSLKTVWVQANVYETDIAQVSQGDSADITTVAYPDKKFKGVISKISNVLDSSASTMQARIVLDNTEGQLKAGMFSSVIVHLDKHKQAAAVPKESLVFYDNDYYVMVAKGKDKFEKRKITIEGTNNEVAYVTQGLKPGEVVVCKNSLYVYGQ
jgi:cobalt-zinc-cadmium efflux system membrane fusion protein